MELQGEEVKNIISSSTPTFALPPKQYQENRIMQVGNAKSRILHISASSPSTVRQAHCTALGIPRKQKLPLIQLKYNSDFL
jgi:hypothetical protein